MSNLNEQFADVITQWRSVDSQRMIFGVNMPQTKNALKGLAQSLQAVHVRFPTFSIVEKEGKIEIIVNAIGSQGAKTTTASIPAHLPALPKLFKELKINSITLNKGITEDELNAFFAGISQPVHEIEKCGGLKGILERNGVKLIVINQMKFQLFNEAEEAITRKDNIGGGLPAGKISLDKKIIAQLNKRHDAVWEDFLNGKLETEHFLQNYQDYVAQASKDPKQLSKLLKRMAKKQKETEKFLATLEGKLSDLGLPNDAVKSLKKKVSAPKKVLVPEDELVRLRTIEKKYNSNMGLRIDDSAETVKVIRKKLRDEMARTEAILHQLSEGGMVLDKNGKILSVNATAQEVLGLSEKEIRGKRIKEVLKPHHLLTTVSDWQKETDDHTPKEVKVHTLNEETLSIIRQSTIILENEDGRSIGVVSALQSVTQQEDLNRRKNDILDVLGHDLRAPLGAIRQNFDVLVASTKLTETCDDKQKKFLENCRSNITRMGKLIEKIMDMRQLETGKITLKFDKVDPNRLIEEAVDSLAEWAHNKRIRLETNSVMLPPIEGDPERLYQVITNLISNALKFTPEGGTIGTTGEVVNEKGKEFIAVSVQDSGMGIEEENLDKIFNKYAQVTANTPKGVSGLGLGLSICKTVIELHGGTIWAESQINKGSTFTFKIPLKPADLPD